MCQLFNDMALYYKLIINTSFKMWVFEESCPLFTSAYSSTLHHAEGSPMWRGVHQTTSCRDHTEKSIHNPMDQKHMCHNPMEWKLSHIAYNHHPFNFTSSLCMMFLLLEMIATMNNTVTIPTGLPGNTNEVMLRITTKCKSSLLGCQWWLECFHIQCVNCIFHLAWPQIKGNSKYKVNSLFFFL